MRVLIGGYYGFDNTGDEAILAALLDDLRALVPALSATVASGDAARTAAQHHVEAVHWLDVPGLMAAAEAADLLILGGGGLFQDYWPFDPGAILTPEHRSIAYYAAFPAMAAIFGKPCALFAVGVGPLTTEAGRALTRAAADQAQAITVRDAHSQALLASLGIQVGRVHVAADPAFRLRPASPDRAEAILRAAGLDLAARPRMGLALRPWDVAVKPEEWEEQVARAADAFLREQGGTAVFVPFHGLSGALQDDAAVAQRVRARMAEAARAVVVDGSHTPAEKAALIGSCDVVLGMRLHSLVFAITAAVPAVALAYDPKVESVMREAGLPDQVLALDHVTADGLAALLARTYERRAELRSTLRAAGQRLALQAEAGVHVALAAAGQPVRATAAASDFARRVAEEQARRHAAAEARAAAAEHDARQARQELAAQQASWGGALVRRLRGARLRVAPSGSRRERALHRGLRGVLALKHRATGRAARPVVETALPLETQLERLVARLPGTRGAIVFLPSIGWDVHLVQRPQHLARAFARAGFLSVFDVSTDPRETQDGLREIEPGVVLFRGPQPVLARIPDATLWTLPYNYDLRAHHPRAARVLYDWIDDLTVFEPLHARALLERNHRTALKDATVVACVARTLHEDALRERKDALYLPNGVEFARFALNGRPDPPDDEALARVIATGRPIAGYYGALAAWFDYDLLDELSRLRPDWSFVLIGPDYDGTVAGQRALAHPNVAWLGPRAYEALPRYLQAFDVAMIPFRINAITRSTSPLKLFEYFAGGKPVVTTPMPECMAFAEVRVAAGAPAFARALDEARADARDPTVRDRLRAAGRANSWQARVETALRALGLY